MKVFANQIHLLLFVCEMRVNTVYVEAGNGWIEEDHTFPHLQETPSVETHQIKKRNP